MPALTGTDHVGVATRDELFRRLEEDPEDGDAFAVFGDLLEAEGDPRGELVAIQNRLAALQALKREERALLARHESALLGPLLELGDRHWEVEWSRGYVKSLTVRTRAAPPRRLERIRNVLAHPSFQLLRSFSLHVPDQATTPIAPALSWLSLPRTIEAISLGWLSSPPELDGPMIGGVVRLLKQTPRLRRLHLHGTVDHASTDLPELRSVTLLGGAAQAGDLLELGRHKWPKLEEATLFLGHRLWAYGEAARDLLPVLERAFPRLRSLTLAGGPPQDTVPALLNGGLLPRLTHLGLTHGGCDDTGAAQIAADAPRFDHLERLDLSSNLLSDGAVQDLQLLRPEVLSALRPGGGVMRCSFCGRAQAEVQRLIAGPSVFICDECVTLMGDILGDEPQ